MFVDDGDDHIVGIHHLGNVNARDLRQQLVSVQFENLIVLVHPGHELGKRNTKGVIEWAIGADGHDGIRVLESGPLQVLSFNKVHLKPNPQRHLDPGARDFAVLLSGMAVADI